MKIAVFQGSFDPFTLGHLDIVRRAARLFDKVYVLVVSNPEKRCLFTAEERRSMIAGTLADDGVANAEAASYEGLTTEFARKVNAGYFIRGLRNPRDYEYESEIEYFNGMLAENIETVYISCRKEYSHVSSSAVKELMKYGADVGALVPVRINKMILGKVDRK